MGTIKLNFALSRRKQGSSPLGSASNSNDLAPMGCLFELLWGVFGE